LAALGRVSAQQFFATFDRVKMARTSPKQSCRMSTCEAPKTVERQLKSAEVNPCIRSIRSICDTFTGILKLGL